MQAGRELNKRDAQVDLEMCEMATAGPWYVRASNGDFAKLADNAGPVLGAGANDMLFVTEARSALPHWIQRAAAAEEEVRRLKNLIGGVVGSLTAWAFNLEDVNLSAEEYQALQQITKPLFEEDTTI